MSVEHLSILEASVLFKHADNVRMQLDFISGSQDVSKEDLLKFNNLLRIIDKIYMSPNTREHRSDLKHFILFNGDAIYKKYVELKQQKVKEDCYSLDL